MCSTTQNEGPGSLHTIPSQCVYSDVVIPRDVPSGTSGPSPLTPGNFRDLYLVRY